MQTRGGQTAAQPPVTSCNTPGSEELFERFHLLPPLPLVMSSGGPCLHLSFPPAFAQLNLWACGAAVGLGFMVSGGANLTNDLD